METLPQHTASKWDIRYERDPFDSKQSTLRIIDATTDHPQGPLTLATINVAAFAPHMEEPFACARLMVAAPALLAALKKTTKCLAWHESQHGTGQDKQAVIDAYAAIVKAENKIIEEDD